MTTILRIQSGSTMERSATRKIGQELVDRLKTRSPGSTLLERDLVKAPVPHIDTSFVDVMFTENDESLALSNQLIAELFASDIVVIESPMYNFGISSALKAWIDHVVRARKTFRISGQGAEGMLNGKKVFLVLGRGGIYTEGPFRPYDFQEPYLKTILGFIGLTDIEVIRIEGLNMGMAEPALAKAGADVAHLLP